MAAVIEGKEEAGAARCIEFKVHRSRGDPDRIVGSWRFAPNEPIVIGHSKPGASAATEFRHVVDRADQHGIPFVWVNDPDELLPPFVRR